MQRWWKKMKIRALQTFRGSLNMQKDEVKDCNDEATVNDLIRMGLIEAVSDSDTEERGKEDVG